MPDHGRSEAGAPPGGGARPAGETQNPEDDTAEPAPAGLMVSAGPRGGYAVPRQLDGHRASRK